MKKSKKFFVSALFSVLGTVGLAGCDMGGSNNPSSGSDSNSNAFQNAIYNSSIFKEELQGNTVEAVNQYFINADLDKNPFIQPNSTSRKDWKTVTVNSAKYIDNDENGHMNGLISINIASIFDHVDVASYVFHLKVDSDGTIEQLILDNSISQGVWNFITEPLGHLPRLKEIGGKFDPKNGVVSITANDAGDFLVGWIPKDIRDKGFQANWIYNAKITLLGLNEHPFTIDVIDGNIVGE